MKKTIKLYVLVLPQMDKDMKFCYSIKFGYSKDFEKRRKPQYLSYFWNVEILQTYDQGSIEIEEKIKYYLKDYLLFGKEWFKYCPEVINFFKTNDTYDKLKVIADTVIIPKKKKTRRVNFELLKYVYQEIFIKEKDPIKRGELEQELKESLKQYLEEDQIKYIVKNYSLKEEDIRSYLADRKEKFNSISDKIKNLAKKFNEIRDVVKKLQFIVALKDEDLTKDELDLFFSYIPDKYKDYYELLGFDGISACKYQESYIKRKIEDICGNSQKEDDLREEIYRLFKVGNRYIKSDIKSTLKNLYERLGYQKTAKASDLEQYFEVKGTLSRDKKAGFEILKKR